MTMKGLSTLCLAVILLLGWALLPAGAQAPSETEQKQGYLLKPGDTLEITVSGEPDYSGEYLLGSSGTIVFGDGSVGEIKVTDLTREQAKTKITTHLAEYLKDPAVSLRISKYRILVSGEVQKPGSYEVTAGETVMDAIGLAGGPNREVALSVVELSRADGTVKLLEPKVFLQTGDLSQNLLLQPGDEILVGRSSLAEEYKVTGAVKFPGSYPLSRMQQTYVFDAIEAAGRWTEEADTRRALLIRKSGDKTEVDLTNLDASPVNPLNHRVEAGDEIFVPRMTTRITVQGGVNNPGEYYVAEGATFLEAVGRAGGLKNNAILKECVLVRSKPETEWMQVNLEKVLRKGDMSENPEVKDGDMLWVAEMAPGGKRDAWDTFRSLAGLLIWAF